MINPPSEIKKSIKIILKYLLSFSRDRQMSLFLIFKYFFLFNIGGDQGYSTRLCLRIQILPADRGIDSLFFPIFPAVVAIPVVGTLLMLFWLNFYLSEQWFRISCTCNVLLFVLDIISYIQAIMISNTPIPARPPKQGPLPPWINEAYRRDKACQKESEEQWKPPRTSHCHICGCVLRMDHHCVWINQCVGGKNHRSFFLFVIYSFLISAQYLLLSINFYFYHFEELNFLMNALWLAWVGIGLFLLFGLGSLAVIQIIMIGNNQTQLELMKANGANPFQKPLQNIYDMGVIANYVDFFEGDTFFWWFPKARNPPFDGCDYIKIPAVTRQQLQKLTPQQKEGLKWGCQYKTFDQAVAAAKQKYSDKVFSFQNQLYRYQDLPS